MELNQNQIINERYKILEKIGVGGMANVYCAKDLKLERKVSFKVLKEEFIDEDFIKKFRTEAQAAAKLSHTNIANVYDFGNEGNVYYIVMEYVDGYTLKEIVKNKVPFSNQETIGIAIQIAAALENAHNNNIVHRDIKPQNILVTKDGIVKVTDFGIARAITSTTITTDTMGSVHYFSPEQARGGYVDNTSDIYSLGIILYEMLTGTLPFDGENTVQLAMKHINEDLPDIKEINPNVSTSLEKIITKCTEKNTSKRYRTAAELSQDLKIALNDETGDFIKSSSRFDTSQETIVISQKEIDEINSENKKKKSRAPKNLNKADYDKKMKKRVTIYAVLTAFLIMFVVSFATFSFLSNLNKVKVPDFSGKTWEQAVKLASQNEIYIKNTKEEYSQDNKVGTIMAQSDKPNTKIQKGETVEVTISLGSDQFNLPDFKGKDISEVYEYLSNYEVKLSEEYVYSDEVEIGKVIKQSPKKGSTISFKDEIKLYISKGSEDTISTVVVPDFTNMNINNAKSYIQSAGLSVGKITTVPSQTVQKDVVISQSPKSGSEVNEKAAVSLTISLGKEEKVPAKEEQAAPSSKEPPKEEGKTEELKIDTNSSQEAATPSEQPKTIKKDTLVIAPSLDEAQGSVEVKVIQKNSSGQSEVYVNSHSFSDFPLKINVSGSEPTEYQLYINGQYQGTETKSFN